MVVGIVSAQSITETGETFHKLAGYGDIIDVKIYGYWDEYLV